MLKLIPLKMELLDSGQPTWEIMKLIIHAQYQITAIGIFAVIAISAIVIGINWAFQQKRVSNIKADLMIQMASIAEDIERVKEIANKEIQSLKGERDRIIMALQADRKNFEQAVVWGGCGIEDFGLAEDASLSKIMIDSTIKFLELSKYINPIDKKNLLKRIIYIPDELSSKKEEILELVNKLPAEDVSKQAEN